MDCKSVVRNSILDAARILESKADELAADIEHNRVIDIHIQIDCEPSSQPTLEISKKYVLDGR